MINNIRKITHSAVLIPLCCGVLIWSATAYGAVAPVVTTLSSITEGTVTPVRIAADQTGNFYVTDQRGGGVLKYNSAGNLLQKIVTTSKNILGIAVAKGGEILVSQGISVAVYSAVGNPVRSFGTFGVANGIAVDSAGLIYVTDSKNNNVQIFNVDYSLQKTFGVTGSGNGQFKQPTGITYEKVSKQIAVTDTLNGRIQFFTTAGVYQSSVGSFGSGPLKFTSPQAVAFDYSADGTTLNRIYVVDSFQANVQVIDAASSSFLRYVGSYGTRGGQLVTPGDVLLDSFSRLIIPNGAGSLVLFGVTAASTAAQSGGTAASFPVAPTGSTPPTLTLNPLSGITKNSTIAISGTVDSGSTVTVNGVSAAVTGGNWSITASLPQQGLNSLVIIASKAGSTSTVNAYVTLNTVAPLVAVSSLPVTGSTTGTPILTVSGSVTDITATTVTVTAKNSSQTVPVNNGLFTAALVLGSGTNTVTVTATDAAGLTSQPVSSTVIYNPLAPVVTLATPSGAVSGSASYTVSGTAPANSVVTVNGVAASLGGARWAATIPLQSGINQITVTAVVDGTNTSTLSSSVSYAPGQPSLAVNSPATDVATAKASPTIFGIASTGTTITASLAGEAIPVTVAADGSFTVSPPPFTAAGTYSVTIDATDANGKQSTTTRSIVYDPTPPALSVVNSTPGAIKVTSGNGVVIARDKNGAVTTPNSSNGTAVLDLSGATYDAATLDVQVLTPTGLSSRDGSIKGQNGTVTIADALLAVQISLGTAPTATFEQRLRGDVGPLVNHLPAPDGKIRLDDAILILQKSVGIDW